MRSASDWILLCAHFIFYHSLEMDIVVPPLFVPIINASVNILEHIFCGPVRAYIQKDCWIEEHVSISF